MLCLGKERKKHEMNDFTLVCLLQLVFLITVHLF